MAPSRRPHVRLTQFDELDLGVVHTTATPESVPAAGDRSAYAVAPTDRQRATGADGLAFGDEARMPN